MICVLAKPIQSTNRDQLVVNEHGQVPYFKNYQDAYSVGHQIDKNLVVLEHYSMDDATHRIELPLTPYERSQRLILN